MKSLSLAEKILIILNSYMSNRKKIDGILILVESEVLEENICLNRHKMRQQILSEILYLFEKIEKNNKCTKRYIEKRVGLLRKNLKNWIFPRKILEESFSEIQKQKPKPKRNTGWHKKTWERFCKYYLQIPQEKKRKNK